MNGLHLIAVALASFIYVAAKAFQQLNVMHDVRKLVPVFTFIMAATEVFIVGSIANEAVGEDTLGLLFLVAAMTIGASWGALLAMELHKRMRERKSK